MVRELITKCNLLWIYMGDEVQARKTASARGFDREDEAALARERRRILYQIPKEDAFGDEIRELVARAEEILRPHLIR